jgi:hypothetical protein
MIGGEEDAKTYLEIGGWVVVRRFVGKYIIDALKGHRTGFDGVF